MHRSLAEKAAQILRDNDRGSYTIPSSRLYPHQWAWDSGFAAIGWAYLDLERAAQEVEAVLAGQWDDGRVPHIQFRNPTPEYFPGPDSWGRDTSTISNPPVWTLAAEVLFEQGLDPERIRQWLPALERSHQFLIKARDPLGLNCIATCHPWENGQDNCPAWDEPMEAIDPNEAPPFQRVDVKKVADASQRPTDEAYKRYMALVHKFTQNGFKPANFLVYDPFFTSLVIRAEQSLARLCSELGEESEAENRAQGLQKGLEALWSPELGRYRYFDGVAKRHLDPFTIGSLAPAMLGPGTKGYDKLRETLQQFAKAKYPLPTVSLDDPSFDPVCYWRGPTWININWLFAPTLGPELTKRTLELVQKSGFWEYFDPRTGEGLGTDGFTWTAALVLDMVNR